MPTFRLPIQESVAQRLPTVDKDAIAVNCFYDKNKKGDFFATKRAGITTYISGSGQANGIFGWNSQVFQWYYNETAWGQFVWTGSKFIAVGNSDFTAAPDQAIFSEDGITWDYSDLPGNSYGSSVAKFQGVSWNGTVYAASNVSGNPSYGATSTDAITWTNRTFPAETTAYLATNGSNLVLSSCYYSTDNGVNWSLGTNGVTGNNIAYASTIGLFCVIRNGTSNTCLTSTDGTSWTSRTLAASATRNIIIASPTRFIATRSSSTATADTSTDGINWSTITLPSARVWGAGGCWTGSQYVLLSSISAYTDATVLAYSSDGTTWSEVTLPTLYNPGYAYDTFYDKVAGNTNIVIVLTGGAFPNTYYYSTDSCVTWTRGDLKLFNTYPVIT